MPAQQFVLTGIHSDRFPWRRESRNVAPKIFTKVSSETKVIDRPKRTLQGTHKKMGSKQKIGSLGEELVVKFLMKRGFKILDRNYRRPWGELDIVAEKNSTIHFVEVKALAQRVSGETIANRKHRRNLTPERVTQETSRQRVLKYIRYAKPKDWYRPEDHVNRNKMLRLRRIIQTYLIGRHVSDETAWQFDVATVLIDEENRKACVNLIGDIILEHR